MDGAGRYWNLAPQGTVSTQGDYPCEAFEYHECCPKLSDQELRMSIAPKPWAAGNGPYVRLSGQ